MRMTPDAYAAATAASPIPVQFRKDAHELIEGFLFPATYAFFSNETARRFVRRQLECVRQGMAPRGHALRALEEPHALRRPHHRVDDRARGRRAARAEARRRGRLQPATGGDAARRSTRRCATASTFRRPSRSRRPSSPRTLRTTRVSARACRRRRSRTPGWRRCRPRRIRPRSTTSTSCVSRTAAATSSRPARPSSTPTRAKGFSADVD